MKKLLLHSCCGPCSSGVVDQLINDYDITILFYNPNIHPAEEYRKRYETQLEYISKLQELGYKISLIEGVYDPENYYKAVKGYENCLEGGKRCEQCFYLRLDYTARYAKTYGYDIFTTTMSVSPHKDYIKLNELGESLSAKYGVEYLSANFKKNNGYLNSINNSKQFGLYRQDYCGCEYSNWKIKK